MARLWGFFKVAITLGLEGFALYLLCNDAKIACIATAVIALYVLFGGGIDLVKDGAVRSKSLPAYQRIKLETALRQLSYEARKAGGGSVKGMKVYLVPDDSMNATAYGGNCISVTRSTLENADPITLKAVLAHEASHILHCDPEFNRAVFCAVTLLVGALSVASFASLVMVFFAFLLFNCFRSWLGLLMFRGTTKVVGGTFGLLQRAIVFVYQATLSMASRRAEYRCDAFAGKLGYAHQLAYFLSISQPEDERRQLSLSQAIYRSHPPTAKRIARLERQLPRPRTARLAR